MKKFLVASLTWHVTRRDTKHKHFIGVDFVMFGAVERGKTKGALLALVIVCARPLY